MLRRLSREFDELEAEALEERRRAVDRLLIAAANLHRSPVQPRMHVQSVSDLLDEAYVDYETGELEEELSRLMESGEIHTDRLGRVVSRYSPDSPLRTSRAFSEVKALTTEMEETEPLPGYDVSFSSRNQVFDHRIPSAIAELRLGRRAALGDRRAVNELVRRNMKLVGYFVRPYRRRSGVMDRDDFFQEGALGLMRAAEKFDVRRGVRFSTYAAWWIPKAAARGGSDKGRTIRIPAHLDEQLKPLLAFSARYRRLAGIEPARQEIAHHFALKSTDVDQIMDLPVKIDSFDGPRGASLTRERDSLEDGKAGEAIAQWLNSSLLRQAIAGLLPDRDQAILIRRFGLSGDPPATLEEIARDMNIRRERVGQILTASLDILRQRVGFLLRDEPRLARDSQIDWDRCLDQ